MSEFTCSRPECTVSQTRICVLNNVPKDCPNAVSALATESVDVGATTAIPPLSPVESTARFPAGRALGAQDTYSITAREYGRLICVLGAPDSGKTACLVSLYLLLSHDQLFGFSFADSKSLMAFDELARGAREWTGEVPEQMTAHTRLDGGRSAGLLHLRLARANQRDVSVFIPDLPGEWTNSLIDSNVSERLSFLRSADVIWLTMDGRALVDISRRHNAIHRVGLLLERLRTLCPAPLPSIRFVVTRLDAAPIADGVAARLVEAAHGAGFDSAVHQVASFSQNDDVRPGKGIAELLNDSVRRVPVESEFWAARGVDATSRSVMKFAQRTT
jgi:hypothetical protein